MSQWKTIKPANTARGWHTISPPKTKGEWHTVSQPQPKANNSWQSLAWNTIKGLPQATVDVGSQTIHHPIQTAEAVGSGVLKGLAPIHKFQQWTNPAYLAAKGIDKLAGTQLAKPSEDAWKRLTEYKPPTETGKGIKQGFELAGSNVPYMIGGEVMGATKLARTSPRLAKYLGWAGTSQAISDKKLTDVKGRAGQLALDTAMFGVTGGFKKPKMPVIPVEIPEASSVISYINNKGEKIYTKISPQELDVLRNEVKNIPTAKGGSQIHLDANTPTLRKVGKEVSRKDFISGHPQAKEVFLTARAESRVPNSAKKTIKTAGNTEKQKIQGVIANAESGPGKMRGFAKTVKQGENTDARLKRLIDSDYVPQANDELVTHAHNLIKKDINKAKVKALKGDDNLSVATAAELIKHYQNIKDFDQAAEITKTVAQKLTEHGRAIQAASLYNKLTPEGVKMFAQKELSKAGLTLSPKQASELQRMAEEATVAKGNDKILKNAEMLKRVGEMIPSKLGDQITTLWKAGLLTSPTTQIANATGNVAMGGMEMAKDIPATVFDKVASLFTGKRTKTTPNLFSYLRGLGEGAKKSWIFLKTGVDIDHTLSKFDFKQVNLPPIAKQYAETIFRALGAGDKIFKEGLMRKSLRELAVVDGLNKGLKGKQLKVYINKLYAKPTIEMVKIATEDALYGTFNDRNVLSDALNKLKSNDSAVVRGFTEFIAPFGRTPSNVAGTILDYSPFGFAKAGVQGFNGAGQRKVVESLGRATVGTGIAGVGYGLGKAGMMTGNYPTNPTERNLWELLGKKPNSFKIGNNYYSLNRLSPIGNVISTGAGMADLGRIKPTNMPAAMAGVAGKNLIGQTYLQGVSGLLNAVQDPKRYGGTFSNRLAASIIPSVLSAGAKALDPTMRQSNSMSEAIQSRIPGLSKNLLPRQNVFGEDRKYSDTGLGQYANPFFNPLYPSKANDTLLNTELNRLYQDYSGLSLGDASKTASIQGTGIKINMTPSEYYSMDKQTGGVIKKVLKKIIVTPDYAKMSDYDKARAINNVVSKVRQIWNIKNVRNLSNSEKQIQEQLKKIKKLRGKPYYGK